eukprot:9767397-Prorocentrum_lima.AAC.1
MPPPDRYLTQTFEQTDIQRPPPFKTTDYSGAPLPPHYCLQSSVPALCFSKICGAKLGLTLII